MRKKKAVRRRKKNYNKWRKKKMSLNKKKNGIGIDLKTEIF